MLDGTRLECSAIYDERRKEEGKESVFFSLLVVSLCEKFMLPSHEPLAAGI